MLKLQSFKKKYNLKLVVLGSSLDIETSKEFENHFDKNDVVNYTSKTNLKEAIEIINGTQIMITNDSGLAHIAAALKKNTIVIANGTHFGRFFPYPPEIYYVKTVYPLEINIESLNENDVIEEYKYRSRLDINLITYQDVIKIADRLMKKK